MSRWSDTPVDFAPFTKPADAVYRTDDSSVLGTVTTVKSEREQAQKSIAENRKAFHDYHILETFEAGVALLGTEVKAIREGNVNLRDSYASVRTARCGS